MNSCFPLPANFRKEDFFEFHRRDALAFAEKITQETLQKGLVWEGHPACLTIHILDQHADAELAVDGAPHPIATGLLQSMAQRMLGLTQPIDIFEQTYQSHAQLGPLIARHPGLRVPLSATPFEALTWAVTGQQISVGAAIALRRKLIHAAGLIHSSGLACYPDADRVAALSVAELRQVGFSQTKAHTLLTLSRMVQDGQLPLADWVTNLPDADEIRERLLRIRGIGPWTVNYALLRGFGWLDGALHGDAAVRRGLQTLLQSSEPISETQASQWLAQFSPWRALVAAHLWALNREGEPTGI